MTILDCCISLKGIKKIWVMLGVVDMHQLLLNTTGTPGFSDLLTALWCLNFDALALRPQLLCLIFQVSAFWSSLSRVFYLKTVHNLKYTGFFYVLKVIKFQSISFYLIVVYMDIENWT